MQQRPNEQGSLLLSYEIVLMGGVQVGRVGTSHVVGRLSLPVLPFSVWLTLD